MREGSSASFVLKYSTLKLSSMFVFLQHSAANHVSLQLLYFCMLKSPRNDLYIVVMKQER